MAASSAVDAAASPIEVVIEGEVGDKRAIKSAMEQALARLDAQVRAIARADGVAEQASDPIVLHHKLPTVLVRRGFALAAHKAASSTPGITEVRALPFVDDKARMLLAHEAAHQLLWSMCPAASRDALFHEAFAVWASGEAPLWLEGDDYLSLPAARALLAKHPLDSRAARRALARLIVEERGIPKAIAQRVRACVDGGLVAKLALEELVTHVDDGVDVAVVLQRATGELVAARGDVERALPFGSTLKPFVVANARMANRAAPLLTPRATEPMWSCHQAGASGGMDVATALLLSCNGYFLDWGKRDADVARLGDLGALLLDYGLSELPADMPQAIGVQASLSISARGLANAFRALSWARPDVIELLSHNATRGTLANARALRGVATKTGTVRGLASAPDLGWLVAVTDDVVVVRVSSGVTPAALVDDVVTQLRELPRAARTVAVQTFGLLPPSQVRARCDGKGAVLYASGAQRAGSVSGSLEQLARRGAALCTGSWLVSFDDDARARPYLGVFTWRPPSERAATRRERAGVTARQARARRGADFVLFTSLGRYTGAVLAAEDSAATGAARDALARVIAHNVTHADERHPGRPLCDTTHCQVFLGGGAPTVGPAQLQPLASHSFLMFSKGGTESWRAERSQAEWRAALRQRWELQGAEADVVFVKDGAIALLVRSLAGDVEEVREVPCEPIRNALRLPSCPSSIVMAGTRVSFSGTGAGHGAGLNVERAKLDAKAGHSVEQLLRAGYGAGIVGDGY